MLTVRLFQRIQRINIQRYRHLICLGIETSCDDTAVALVSDDKRRIIRTCRYADREEQRKVGGICPGTVAQQHKRHLPRLLEECLGSSGYSMNDVDAISVTTKPGLVIALKEGIHKALELSRRYSKTLVSVHHMRAHALSSLLVSKDLVFPFICLLISGGHSMIVLVHSVNGFEILGKSLSGSAGECLDKVARELKIQEEPEFHGIHAGAAVEILASRSQSGGHLRYDFRGPSVLGADMDFSQLKSSMLEKARKAVKDDDFDVEDFCASAQFHVTRHLVTRLNAALDHLSGLPNSPPVRHLVVSGGVAANAYISNGVSKLCAHYGISMVPLPPALCTDNAEMVAWTGILMLQEQSKSGVRSPDIYHPPNIPNSLYAHARFDIGDDIRDTLPRRAKNHLSGLTVHGDIPIKLINKEEMRNRERQISD